MKKVEGIIIGAARAGTTTLASYMDVHPSIDFSKEKEVHFFAFEDLFQKGDTYLNSFFKNDGRCKITADTYLLIDKNAPEKTKQYNPNMKIVLVLRDPVLRAFSGYNYSVRNGYINKNISFIDACQQEKEFENSDDIVQKNNMCNILRSKYYSGLQYWMQFFPKENFLLLKTSDLKDNIPFVLRQISGFFNIEYKNLNINDNIKNKAFKVRSKKLQQFLVNRNNPTRLFLKKIIPSFINRFLIKTGTVKKIADMNKQAKEYNKINDEEYSFAYKMLEEDILNLKKTYNIDFTR
ncbi:MAG: sulfotransferase domain-containing protein [Bacteroidales bacterium]|nr:sulfotransferase domain-containing protein [Bacteroidales bacterium]